MAESLGTAVLDLTTDDSRLRSGLARGERDTKSSFSRMSVGVIRSAAGIATAFGAYKLGKALFVDPIRMAGNFQQTLKVLGAVAGVSGADLKKLGDRAIKLGADVRLPATSAQDAADAMLQLAKAGMSTGQIMGSVHAVLLLSAAAEISNADAADMVTKAMGAFGLKASDTGKIVDDFAGAANASQSSIQDVGLAMTQAGAGFKALRVPIGDASTAIALMAKNGIVGGMAGAALNVAFTRLANPTKKATDTLKEMNVHLFDSNGKFVGVRGAIEQISPKLADMSDKQRLATLAILGGTRGMKALQFVLGGGTKAWDETRKAVEKAGQAQQIANAKTAGFNGAMSGLRSTLETLQITLGTKVLPKATEFIRFLERVAGAPSFTVAIKIVWQGLLSLGSDLKKAISDALFGATKDIGTEHGGVAIGVSFKPEPGIVDKLRATLEQMVATTDWGAIGKRIGDGISKSIKISTDAINQGMNAMLAWVNSHSGQIAAIGLVIGLTMLSKIMDPSFWAQHWALIGGVILSAASFAFPAGKFAIIGEKLAAGAFGLFGKTIGKLVLDGLELLPGVVGRFAPKLVAAMGAMLAKVVTESVFWGIRLADAFISKISGGFGRLSGIVKTLLYTGIVNQIGNAIGDAVGRAQALAQGVAGAIKSIPGRLQGLAGDILGKVRAAISEAAGAAVGAARAIGFAIADGILSGVGNLASRLAGTLKSAVGGALGSVKGAFGIGSPSRVFASEVGDPIAQGIIKGFSDGIGKLSTTMNASLAKIADDAATMTKANASKVGTAFKSWWAEAKKGADDSFAALSKTLDAQLTKAQAQIASFKAKLTPTELQIKVAQAAAELQKLNADVDAAWLAVNALPAAQAKAWSQLLAQQQANIAALKATLQSTTDDALLAGNTFNKGMAAAASDPIAQNLIEAQKEFDYIKGLFDQGLVSQAEFIRYANLLDDAKIAAGEDNNAIQLLDQYNTWQAALVQQAQAGAAITTQQAADLEAQNAQQVTFQTESATAWDTYFTARGALGDHYIQETANKERAARDAEATELNTHLVNRYARIQTHLENVKKRTDQHFGEMARSAETGGKNLIDSLSNAIENAKPTLDAALKAITNEIAKYLKVNSPTEKGPMRTLNHWWDDFSQTLLSGLDRKLLTNTLSDAVSPRLNTSMMTPYAGSSVAGSAAAGVGHQENNFIFHETPANADPVAIQSSVSYAMKNLRT